MKKFALLGLTLMLLCFISGGVYIISSTYDATSKLERIMDFDRVEYLREKLANSIRTSQADLLLKGSVHATDAQITITYAHALEADADICFTCHHFPQTQNLLEHLKQSVHTYLHLISRTLTIQANQERVEQTKMAAFIQGESLLKEVNSLSVASAGKIGTRIDGIRADVHATNRFLIACVVLGPISIILIAFFFIQRFTGSIDTLVEANLRLESGDLDYRITAPLKNEFKKLAQAFNHMVESLNRERERVKSVRALYQTLFESAGDAIMITSLEADSIGQIISANGAATSLYGYTLEELLGMNILELAPEGKAESFKRRLGDVLPGEWTSSRVKRRRKDGRVIPIDMSLGLLRMDEKKYALSFCRDISEKLQAEEDLQRANQFALVGQMAAGLAHEIKNPLAGVKVSLDVLADELKETMKEEDKDLFSRIISEITRMERLLKSLLNYARPPQPQFDKIDINRLLEKSIKNVEVTTGNGSGRRIEFINQLEPDLQPIEADPAQLQQVFLNIYLNAIDAMEESGTITTETSTPGENQVRVAISDTGTGMSPEAVDKIFSPFFTTKSKGTGLGLSICRRLVEQHGGKIEVESRDGEGTSFICYFPFAQKFME